MCGPYIPDRWVFVFLMWMILLAPLAALSSEGAPDPTPTYHIRAAVDSVGAQALSVAEFLRARRFPCDGPSCVSDSEVLAISRIVVKEAGRVGANPMMVASIITVEDPWLDTTIVSHAGAVGLMQVMEEIWVGEFEEECGADLRRVRVNVCTGVRIAERYGVFGDAPTGGLLRYNGCRPGYGCSWYADTVLARAD